MVTPGAYIAAGVVTFAAVLTWDIIDDYRKFVNTRSVRHKREFWIRVALLLPSMFAFVLANFTLLNLLIVPAMEGFVFLNVFDGVSNWLKNQKWFWTGTHSAAETDDSATDGFLERQPFWLNVVIKVGGSALAIFFYAWSFYN